MNGFKMGAAGRLAALALAAALLPAGAGATTYSADFSGPGPDPNLQFAPTGPIFLGVGGGDATIFQPGGAGTAIGIVSTKFTVDGDFTATITGNFLFAPTCNLCGNQEIGAFQANFNAGGVANLFGVSDENIAVFLGDNLDNTFIEHGFYAQGGDTLNSFQIQRIGGIVSIGVGIGGTPPFNIRHTSGAADLQGPVAFEFFMENNHNGGAGETAWSNFTITADRFNGLQSTSAGVPEPASWALMILGFGLAGATLRSGRGSRRRRTEPNDPSSREASVAGLSSDLPARFAAAAIASAMILGAGSASAAVALSYTGAVVSWTAPSAGVYDILTYGANGGGAFGQFAGAGAKIGGDFTLHSGETLSIAVGGVGGDGGYCCSAGGGGGGTYVLGPGNVPLVIAGGGGGAGRGGTAGGNGGAYGGGGGGEYYLGGGQGVDGGSFGGMGEGGGGAGQGLFIYNTTYGSSGGAGGAYGQGGGGASGGGGGGLYGSGGGGDPGGVAGGFGGGGTGAGDASQGGLAGGGGGGGYSGGGGGGGYNSYYSGGGGGGGSYLDLALLADSANTVAFSEPGNVLGDAGGAGIQSEYQGAFLNGNGGVFIDFVHAVAAVPEPAAWTSLLLGFGGLGAMLRRARRAGGAINA